MNQEDNIIIKIIVFFGIYKKIQLVVIYPYRKSGSGARNLFVFPTVIVFAPEPLDPSFAYDPDIASRNQELRESILPAEREAIKKH
ncbi:hypothetical protein GCM10020331_092120 [Ectobacillus funiculus]